MSENKTSWQKLSAVFGDAREKPYEYNSDTMAVSLMSALAEAIENGDPVYAAVTAAKKNGDGTVGLTFRVMQRNGSTYYVVFPDQAAAEVMGMKAVEMKTEDLVKILLNSKKIDGMQVVLAADAKTHRFSTGEISKKTAASILEAAGNNDQ
ncbi:MAG: hypothetical protein J6K77_08730 [Ruminococcus sp.]|nr:hypothetical protein [Ruminococcus sp.]